MKATKLVIGASLLIALAAAIPSAAADHIGNDVSVVQCLQDETCRVDNLAAEILECEAVIEAFGTPGGHTEDDIIAECSAV